MRTGGRGEIEVVASHGGTGGSLGLGRRWIEQVRPANTL